uniref:Uncharacterized protein n=1 Tax=Timema douglasi TaxID=61478 RepID=A0A7R8VS04_TIMDO|nr:unnamed protein product [Timema douglasi]
MISCPQLDDRTESHMFGSSRYRPDATSSTSSRPYWQIRALLAFFVGTSGDCTIVACFGLISILAFVMNRLDLHVGLHQADIRGDAKDPLEDQLYSLPPEIWNRKVRSVLPQVQLSDDANEKQQESTNKGSITNIAYMSPKKRKEWNSGDMWKAILAARKKEMGLLKASKTFNVPKSILKEKARREEAVDKLPRTVINRKKKLSFSSSSSDEDQQEPPLVETDDEDSDEHYYNDKPACVFMFLTVCYNDKKKSRVCSQYATSISLCVHVPDICYNDKKKSRVCSQYATSISLCDKKLRVCSQYATSISLCVHVPDICYNDKKKSRVCSQYATSISLCDKKLRVCSQYATSISLCVHVPDICYSDKKTLRVCSQYTTSISLCDKKKLRTVPKVLVDGYPAIILACQTQYGAYDTSQAPPCQPAKTRLTNESLRIKRSRAVDLCSCRVLVDVGGTQDQSVNVTTSSTDTASVLSVKLATSWAQVPTLGSHGVSCTTHDHVSRGHELVETNSQVVIVAVALDKRWTKQRF